MRVVYTAAPTITMQTAWGPDAALLRYEPSHGGDDGFEHDNRRHRTVDYGGGNRKNEMSWFRAFFEYLGISRWPRGVIILQLVCMVVLFLCEAIYYLVGSFRFRDEHVGAWHICFLVLQTLLVGSYLLLYFIASRWYHLWDATVRATAHDIIELNITLPVLTATLSAIQITALVYYGVVLDLSITGPHTQTLVAYRQVNFMAGVCAAILCYVAYHCTPAFTRKAPDVRRWVIQSAGGGGGGGGMTLPDDGYPSVATSRGGIKQL